MATETTSEQVKQYLLGTLSAEDKLRFEEKYFDDDNLFEEIEIVEDELIDAYVREQLAPRDRERFKEVVTASPRLTNRVDFARVLAKSTASPQPANVAVPIRVERDDESFWRRLFAPNRGGWAMAACMTLLLLGGGLLLFGWMRLRAESRRLGLERAELEQRERTLANELNQRNAELTARLEDAQAENARLQKELESSPKETQASTPKNPVVAFFIASGGLRSGGGENRVVISSKFPEVRLNLGLESNDYSNYNATIKTVEEKTIWSRGGLKAQTGRSGKVVELKVPTSQLLSGTYIVELSGLNTAGVVEPVMKYSFRVVKN